MGDVRNLYEAWSTDTTLELLKVKLQAKHAIMCVKLEDGTFGVLIEDEITDIDLCYMIDSLQAARSERYET